MRYDIYILKGKTVNCGLIYDKKKQNRDLIGWEYVASARTQEEAKKIFKALPNCWNN